MIAGVIWVLIVVTLLGCVLSVLHYALRDYNMVKLQEIVERRGGNALVDRVLEDVPGHVLATGALRSLCNVAITVCAVLLFDVFRPGLADGPLQVQWGQLLWAFVLASGLIYFFGIVLPMSLAEHAGERMICMMSAPLRGLHVLSWPLRALGFIDTAIRRLAGAEHVSDQEQIQDELISVAAEGEREGTLNQTERSMIESIVGFKDRTVEEIMTPRTEIEGIELTDDLSTIQRFVLERGHSRIPVYQGDLDHIVGVLYAKDLIKYLATDPAKFKLKPVLRRPVWVPETKPLTDLLYELRARKVHMAIVLDEYGGTTGLVTFEDLLEEIVGEIQDEYEPLAESLPEVELKPETREAEVEARAYITDVNDAIESLGVEVPESEDYDTMGGYVLSKLGHIPVVGETIETELFRVTVLEAEPTRVVKLKIEALREGESAEGSREEAAPDESASAPAGRTPEPA